MSKLVVRKCDYEITLNDIKYVLIAIFRPLSSAVDFRVQKGYLNHSTTSSIKLFKFWYKLRLTYIDIYIYIYSI